MLKLHSLEPDKFKWISHVKSIFDDTGLSFIWDDQIPLEKQVLKSMLSVQLKDQFIQHWQSSMSNSSRGDFYSKFKTTFGLENYLLRLQQADRLFISKFRCSNLKIPSY